MMVKYSLTLKYNQVINLLRPFSKFFKRGGQWDGNIFCGTWVVILIWSCLMRICTDWYFTFVRCTHSTNSCLTCLFVLQVYANYLGLSHKCETFLCRQNYHHEWSLTQRKSFQLTMPTFKSITFWYKSNISNKGIIICDLQWDGNNTGNNMESMYLAFTGFMGFGSQCIHSTDILVTSH